MKWKDRFYIIILFGLILSISCAFAYVKGQEDYRDRWYNLYLQQCSAKEIYKDSLIRQNRMVLEYIILLNNCRNGSNNH